ncbi:MAG: ABC transporter ATP-binding protein [Nitrospirota bacterium]
MIQLREVEKVYRRGAEEVHALRGVDLDIREGELLSIVGPSGAGKTTLLHILGCLDTPTAGSVRFDGVEVEHMAESELVVLRRKKIGFIFQQFYLIPGLTVAENVALPLLFNRRAVQRDRIASIVEMVGLKERMHHAPNQLSGGEMQRVAIARSLVNDPEVVLADEPTGNLDSENSERIFELLRTLNRKGLTVVMITHNGDLASRADRVVRIKDGRVQAA